MRETKQYTLEEIHSVFKKSTRKMVSYRIYTELPYAFKRYILRKHVRLEPFDESRHDGNTAFYSDADESLLHEV